MVSDEHLIAGTKVIVAGVGGQGVVFLTDLLVRAAVAKELPVATSEIHGLAQRGGSVVSAITFGNNATGFVGTAEADFLIGLEPLEAQRCVTYLNRESLVVINGNEVPPYPVMASGKGYPNTDAFVGFLQRNVRHVSYINPLPGNVHPMARNLFAASLASKDDFFPLSVEDLRKVVGELPDNRSRQFSLDAIDAAMYYFGPTNHESSNH